MLWPPPLLLRQYCDCCPVHLVHFVPPTAVAFRIYDIGGNNRIERSELKRFLVALMADNPDVDLDEQALDDIVDQVCVGVWGWLRPASVLLSLLPMRAQLCPLICPLPVCLPACLPTTPADLQGDGPDQGWSDQPRGVDGPGAPQPRWGGCAGCVWGGAVCVLGVAAYYLSE
jgi:hypothetical protein